MHTCLSSRIQNSELNCVFIFGIISHIIYSEDFLDLVSLLNLLPVLDFFEILDFHDLLDLTDKRTDAFSRHFMIKKSILGCGLGWAGLWNKRFWPIMSNFWGQFFQLFVGKFFFFENIVAENLSV